MSEIRDLEKALLKGEEKEDFYYEEIILIIEIEIEEEEEENEGEY
jgi:hypothetical protein